MNTATDNGNQSALTVTQAAQSFASILDSEPVDSESEAQVEAEMPETQEVESEGEQAEATEEYAEEPEDEADSESEDADEEIESQPEKYVVKVDGEEIEVTRDELIRGYQREADYTRKTQKLAEQRKSVESELNAVKGEREQYAQILGQLQQKLSEMETAEPDWDALEREDPIEYARQWTHFQRRREQQAAVKAEQDRLSQLKQAEYTKHLQETLVQEAAKLVEAIPEWKNPETAKAQKDGILEYGRKLGFSDAELDQVTDHRAVIALYKAWQYDQLMSKKPQVQAKVKSATKTAAPGSAGTAPKKVSESTRAKQRLAQSGRVRDAATLFEKFI